MLSRNLLKNALKCVQDTSLHSSLRKFSVNSALLNHNKFDRGLNPWDEKIELEGTNKAMSFPAYNERYFSVMYLIIKLIYISMVRRPTFLHFLIKQLLTSNSNKWSHYLY